MTNGAGPSGFPRHRGRQSRGMGVGYTCECCAGTSSNVHPIPSCPQTPCSRHVAVHSPHPPKHPHLFGSRSFTRSALPTPAP